MAHIVKFASDGTPEVLEFKDVPEPQPAAGEVRIASRRSASTARKAPSPMPLVPFGDFCIKVRSTTRSQNGQVMQVLVSDLIVQRRDR
jgi:hypothetical protein